MIQKITLFVLIIIFLLIWRGCPRKEGIEQPISERVLWYNSKANIGILSEKYNGSFATEGYEYEHFYFTILPNSNKDTLLAKTTDKFPDWEFKDSLILMYRSPDNFGFLHGWFKFKNGKFVDFDEVISKKPANLPNKDYYYRNGMIIEYDRETGNLILDKPIFDYGKIIGVETPFWGKKFCIYRLDGKNLKCVSEDYKYKIKQDGIYFIPYPGLIEHKTITIQEKLNEIIKNGKVKK